ncbi:glycoside hydrolase family 18 protein [Mycena crocata]|nr:glycoside hydrolase family 18 protein [Mycena crocata]
MHFSAFYGLVLISTTAFLPALCTPVHPPDATSIKPRQTASMVPPYFVIYVDSEGPPAVDDLKGFNVVCMSFLLANGTAVEGARLWMNMAASDRTALKQQYTEAGIKLFVSAFGGTVRTDRPTTMGLDPKNSATTVANWAKQYQVDGVDMDYEDFDAMGKGVAEKWVTDFTTQLHTDLGGNYLITAAPMPAWFTPLGNTALPGGGFLTVDKAVGSMINWYNIQFYNSGPQQFLTCDTLLNKADVTAGPAAPGTSLFEIHSGSRYKKLENGDYDLAVLSGWCSVRIYTRGS